MSLLDAPKYIVKCPGCSKTWKLRPHLFPFHCACGTVIPFQKGAPKIKTPKREPQPQQVQVVSDEGVGKQIKMLLDSIGAVESSSCSCAAMVAQMNHWGVEGCRRNKAAIKQHLKEAYHQAGRLITHLIKTVTTGLALKLNPLDPIGSLIDLAIAQEEERLRSLPEAPPPQCSL